MYKGYHYHLVGGEKLHLFGRCIGLTAAFLRLTPLLPSFCWPLQNKYITWTLMFVIVRHTRPFIADLDVVKMLMVAAVLLSALAVSCYIKVSSGYYPSNVIVAKKLAAQAKFN